MILERLIFFKVFIFTVLILYVLSVFPVSALSKPKGVKTSYKRYSIFKYKNEDILCEPYIVKKGDWLESYGWWCIFGCNIVLRHISDEKDLQRYMALFTNKADEIADRLNHWAMRERVFSMQFEGRNRLVGWTGQDIPVVIDKDDIRLITGTMGRFPQFKETGWSLLNTGNVVEES